MKILAVTDTHTSKKALESFIKKAKKQKPDLIISAGDLSIFGNGLDEILKEIDTLKIPHLAIHGNHELLEDFKRSVKKTKHSKNIHKKMIDFRGFTIVGWGGGGFSLKESPFEKFIKTNRQKLKKKKLILVTHAPPYNTKIDKIIGEPCGNKSIRKFIEKFKPIAAISGHLHENAKKKDKIDNTLVINPGPEGKMINLT